VRPRRGDLRDALEPASRAGRPRRPWASPLAEEIARELASEPLGLPLAELGRRLRRREGDIRAELRNSPHFVPSGETKGRRWHLVETRRSMSGVLLPARRGGQWAGISANPGAIAANEPSNVIEPPQAATWRTLVDSAASDLASRLAAHGAARVQVVAVVGDDVHQARAS
jgi:hypothetical protein